MPLPSFFNPVPHRPKSIPPHQLYTEALAALREDDKDGRAVALASRAAAYLKLKQDADAFEDASRACELKPDYEVAAYRKGCVHLCLLRLAIHLLIWTRCAEADESTSRLPHACCLPAQCGPATISHTPHRLAAFALGRYAEAKASLEAGLALRKGQDADTRKYGAWLRKCQLELEDAPPVTPAAAAAATHTPVSVVPAAAAVGPVAKSQWYQSATHATVTLLQKGLKEEDADVRIEPRRVRWASGESNEREVIGPWALPFMPCPPIGHTRLNLTAADGGPQGARARRDGAVRQAALRRRGASGVPGQVLQHQGRWLNDDVVLGLRSLTGWLAASPDDPPSLSCFHTHPPRPGGDQTQEGHPLPVGRPLRLVHARRPHRHCGCPPAHAHGAGGECRQRGWEGGPPAAVREPQGLGGGGAGDHQGAGGREGAHGREGGKGSMRCAVEYVCARCFKNRICCVFFNRVFT